MATTKTENARGDVDLPISMARTIGTILHGKKVSSVDAIICIVA